MDINMNLDKKLTRSKVRLFISEGGAVEHVATGVFLIALILFGDLMLEEANLPDAGVGDGISGKLAPLQPIRRRHGETGADDRQNDGAQKRETERSRCLYRHRCFYICFVGC